MDKSKQLSQQEKETAITQSKFWGAISLGTLVFLVDAYLMSALFQAPGTLINYIAIGVFALVLAAAIVSIILIIRGRQELGTKLVFYAAWGIGISASALYQGRTLNASLSLLFITATAILGLFPKASRLRFFGISGAAFILMWIFEWINPPWRSQVATATVGPAVAIVFLLVLVAMAVRQAWGILTYSISNRLTALVLIVTIPLLIGITFYISNRAGSEIEAQAILNLQQNNQSFATNISTWLELQVQTVKEMSALPDITSLDATRTKATLKVIANSRPNLFLVHTSDLNGMNIARNDDADLINYGDRAWFLSAKQGEPFSFEVVISRTIGKPVLVISAPIYNQSDIVGVAAIISELTEISDELLAVEERRGVTYIVDANNRVVAHPDPTYTEGELRDLSAYPPVTALREGTTGKFTFKDENGIFWVAYLTRLENDWAIISQQPEAELLAPVRQFQTVSIIFILIGSTVMFALAWYAIRRSLQSIGNLTTTASAIAAGDLDRVAEITSRDEIGVLASTFNIMTAQLRETLRGLEQRVEERTRNLELAAEVGRSVSQVHALDVMLKDACELILKEFNLYYVQVYLTDPSQTTLQLEAGTGNVGEQLLARNHSLPLNTNSINGRAAVEKRPIVISNTTQSATFRQNPLLPETRAEMAVPLIVADQVVGVLDMQSSQPGGLNEEVLSAFEALAGQLAVAIQNANLLAETEQARAQVEAQARRLVRQGWNEHLDAIHKPEHLGFVFDHDRVFPLTNVNESDLPEAGQAISASISVTGESLGTLAVEITDESRREQITELVNIVARQMAQQIENLRLLESAERYRFEAEHAARLQTIEGWQAYVSSRTADSLGYLYNLNEVIPSNNAQADDNALTIPVKARDEKVGRLSIQGLTSDNQEELELANVVAERLGAHIESLRLFEETRRGQAELDKRAKQLAAVAEISNVSSKELDVQKMLESVVHLTQRQFGLYHAHVFIFNEKTEELQIAACGWKEGDEHEGAHGTTSIPINREQSLVARAARTRKAVIVNNVFVEPGWMPNPLLPDTVSELAVPLVIGDQVLGVLDVQSDRLNAFTEEDANIQTTLASQVATALQNARSFAQAQKQAEREAMLNVINQKIQSATSVEAVLQIAARELGHALGAPMTVAQLSMKNKAS